MACEVHFSASQLPCVLGQVISISSYLPFYLVEWLPNLEAPPHPCMGLQLGCQDLLLKGAVSI